MDGDRREVPSRYFLKGARQVAFEVGAYDRNQPLIIDPVLAYSTYLGGLSTDAVAGIAVDGVGNAYVNGATIYFNFTCATTARKQASSASLRSGARRFFSV